MIPIERLKSGFPRAAALVEPHFDVLRKATSFALVGVINVFIDAGVFFTAYWYLTGAGPVLRQLDALAAYCNCSAETALLIIANVTSWTVAVSGSYVMNSFFTFAAVTGRRLRWRDYITFVASGVLGAVANTITLVLAAHVMPVLAAKGCSIVMGFFVNFTMSHFVVFSPRRRAAAPRTAMRAEPPFPTADMQDVPRAAPGIGPFGSNGHAGREWKH